jgi:hypothetical protein
MKGFSSSRQSLFRSRKAGRRWLGLVGLGCALGLMGLAVTTQAAQSTSGYQVITHPKNPTSSVSREFLSDVFLKRVTRWDSSERTAPVDLRLDSPVRAAFSRSVLNRSIAAVRSYWTQRIFSGRDVPPPELDSDEAVARFVAGHPGAVGYVSAGPVPAGVKPLEVR